MERSARAFERVSKTSSKPLEQPVCVWFYRDRRPFQGKGQPAHVRTALVRTYKRTKQPTMLEEGSADSLLPLSEQENVAVGGDESDASWADEDSDPAPALALELARWPFVVAASLHGRRRRPGAHDNARWWRGAGAVGMSSTGRVAADHRASRRTAIGRLGPRRGRGDAARSRRGGAAARRRRGAAAASRGRGRGAGPTTERPERIVHGERSAQARAARQDVPPGGPDRRGGKRRLRPPRGRDARLVETTRRSDLGAVEPRLGAGPGLRRAGGAPVGGRAARGGGRARGRPDVAEKSSVRPGVFRRARRVPRERGRRRGRARARARRALVL